MRSSTPSKRELLAAGQEHIFLWCRRNGEPLPEVRVYPTRKPPFGTCAYWRCGVIHIWTEACASVGMAGRAWSYPGYVVDRTPYGVLAHELGHHVEGARGARGGNVARRWRRETGEPPLTGYCPNDNEWFAEHFRLFVTNPDLLRDLRPRLYPLLMERWPRPAETRCWELVLAGAERQARAAMNKIAKVR